MPAILIKSGPINSRPRINLSNLRVIFTTEQRQDDITSVVARHFNQQMEALLTHTRCWDIAWPRMVAIRLMHETGFTDPIIEKYFGMKKGYARFAWHRVLERAETEPHFMKSLNSLRERIKPT